MRNLVIVGMLLAATVPANAATVFDSAALGEALCLDPGYTCVTSRRDSYFNYAAVLNFAADQTVSQIGVYSTVGGDQNVEFLIFASGYDVGSGTTDGGTLLFAQTKFFTARGLGYLDSDALSFTFRAGQTYDVGIVGDGNSLTGRYVMMTDQTTTPLQLTTGAITEYAANANILVQPYDASRPDTTGFAHPTVGGYTNSASYIRLIGAANGSTTGTVPEPATWALMIAGFGLVGGVLRRRPVAAA